MRKIDYFVFSVPKVGETDFVITEQDDENTRWIKATDMQLYKESSAAGMAIVYSRATADFYKDGKPILMHGENVFPRAFIPYNEELLKALKRVGAKSITTVEDCDKITHWPLKIQPYHRRVVETTYGEFKKHYMKYQDMFLQTFIKTAVKSGLHKALTFYGVLPIDGNNVFFTSPPIFGLADEEKIFLSEKITPINDPINDVHSHEYRAFVVDGEVLSVSRSYVDYPVETPLEVLDFIDRVVMKCNRTIDFPKSYCLDVGEHLNDEKRVVDIIEFNPISASGLEASHDLVSEVLKNNQKRQEKAQE